MDIDVDADVDVDVSAGVSAGVHVDVEADVEVEVKEKVEVWRCKWMRKCINLHDIRLAAVLFGTLVTQAIVA